MSGLHTNDTLLFRLQIDLEKLLHDVVAILEVGVLQLKFQLDENVVVFVVRQAEAISFKHLTVRHTPVADIDLGAFRVHIFPSLYLKFVLLGTSLQRLLPHSLSLILVCCRAKLLYFFLLGRLALLLRFGLCAQNLHLSQHVKVTIRAQPRRVLTIVLRLFALA